MSAVYTRIDDETTGGATIESEFLAPILCVSIFFGDSQLLERLGTCYQGRCALLRIASGATIRIRRCMIYRIPNISPNLLEELDSVKKWRRKTVCKLWQILYRVAPSAIGGDGDPSAMLQHFHCLPPTFVLDE